MMSVGLWGVLAALGGAAWTFAEYALHRWEGHRRRFKHYGTRLHMEHHVSPNDFPGGPFKLSWLLAVVGPLGVVTYAVGGLVGTGFAVGFGAGYLLYEWVHVSIHLHPPTSDYGYWLRKHHFAHHFTNPKGNHGVLTDVWDRVFGTLLPARRIRVPRKYAPPGCTMKRVFGLRSRRTTSS